jgi:hypothetical protein
MYPKSLIVTRGKLFGNPTNKMKIDYLPEPLEEEDFTEFLLPIDATDEMQSHFGIYAEVDEETS